MSKIKKISISILIGIMIIFGIQSISNAYEVGQKLTITYNQYINSNNIFCVERGQGLTSDNSYKIISKVTINGKISIDHKNGKVVSNRNSKFAYLLCQDNRDEHDGPVQQGVWNYARNWLGGTGGVGIHHAGLKDYNSFASKVSGDDTTENEEAIADGEEYVEEYNRFKGIKDNTKKENIKVKTYNKEGKQYIRIGPFNWTFGGKLTRVSMHDQDGKRIADKLYSTFNGKKEKWIDIGDIKSDKDFYISIPADKGVTRITKVSGEAELDVRNVTIWFLDSLYKSIQNLIIIEPNIVKETENFEFDYDILLSGNLKVIKVNANNEKITLPGVGFKIKNKETGKYIKKSSNGNISYVNSKNAEEFMTDAKGEINIENLIVGTYVAYETKNPNYGYEIISEGKEATVTIDKTAELKIPNKQKYIKLSGYVWVDNILGKQSTNNNLYDNNSSEDKLLDGITVRLMDKTTGQIVKETTTENGGKYLFTDVLVDDLDKYYIEFEYDGLTYTNVVPHIKEDNGSKAAESSTERTNFNQNFSVVEGVSNNTGKTLDKHGEKAYDLTYNVKDHVATLDHTKASYNITANTENTGNTDEEKYIIKEHYRPGQEEIENINLGLYVREQPDIALVQDVENVKLSINGYTHVYEYASRYKEENQKEYINQYYEEIYTGKERYKAQKTDDGKIEYIKDSNGDYVLVEGEYIHMNIFNVGVKYKTEYTDRENPYKRAIYQSDYNYFKADSTSNKLDVHITYKIKMKNESTGLDVCVNSLVDYYDSRYNVLNVGTALDEQKNIDGDSRLGYSVEQTDNEGYKKLIIKTGYKDKTKDVKEIIGTQKEKEIYVQFELTKEAKLNILNDTENLNNVVEINSYSVFEEGNVYAGIDKDSNPGNAVPGDLSTYEDDTDEAPGILLEVKQSREMTGKVFLDESTGGVGLVREGDGEYKEGEKGIKEVEVALIDNDGNIVKVYNESTNKWEEAKVTTGDDGSFSIKGFIPGDYTLTYTWGDETYFVDQNGNKQNINVNDYKGTIWTQENQKQKAGLRNEWYKAEAPQYSDAKDDYIMRGLLDSIEDTNRDGKIDESEITPYVEKIGKVVTGEIELTEERKNMMDINQDGKITVFDGTALQRKYQGKEFKMNSTTPVMGVGIEEQTDGNTKYGITSIKTEVDGDMFITKDFKIRNIDFGIVERARQELAIDKKVESVEIILANGQTIASLKYNEEGKIEATKGIVYISATPGNNGMIKAEIDSELIQGATVNIKYAIVVNNNSELDYDTRDYYLYGTLPLENIREDKTIRYIPSEIYDYIDNTLAVKENTNWEITEIDKYNEHNSEVTTLEKYIENQDTGYEYFKEWYNISEWSMENIKQARGRRFADKTILYNKENIEVLPGKSQKLAELNASKVLTNTDDISLNNDVEITKVTRTGDTGRTLTVNELYDSGETVTITPPTGESKDYILIGALGMTLLVTLATGIVLIKKKIL